MLAQLGRVALRHGGAQVLVDEHVERARSIADEGAERRDGRREACPSLLLEAVDEWACGSARCRSEAVAQARRAGAEALGAPRCDDSVGVFEAAQQRREEVGDARAPSGEARRAARSCESC